MSPLDTSSSVQKCFDRILPFLGGQEFEEYGNVVDNDVAIEGDKVPGEFVAELGCK